MAAKGKSGSAEAARGAPRTSAARRSALIDTRVIYCGDCIDRRSEPRPSGSGPQPAPEPCVDLIYIDPPFNSNRNYEVFWGDLSEPRPPALYVAQPCQGLGSRFQPPFKNRHASTAAYIDYMRPRCAQLPRAQQKRISVNHRQG